MTKFLTVVIAIALFCWHPIGMLILLILAVLFLCQAEKNAEKQTDQPLNAQDILTMIRYRNGQAPEPQAHQSDSRRCSRRRS